MEITYTENQIVFKKQLNTLDKFVIDFTSLLNRLDICYVIVSGYVTILFGRSRVSEDVDIIVERIEFDKFEKLWDALKKDFVCINAKEAKEAFGRYLQAGVALRFAKKNRFIPNIEFKFPKISLDLWTLRERKKVLLNNHEIFISPLELQIPFKLYLGSEKDIEDAKYLYNLFKNNIDTNVLNEFIQKLKTEELFKRYLE